MFSIFQDPVVCHLYMGTKNLLKQDYKRNIENIYQEMICKVFCKKIKHRRLFRHPENFEKIMNYQYSRVKYYQETQKLFPDSFSNVVIATYHTITLTMAQDHRQLPSNSIAIMVICITIKLKF